MINLNADEEIATVCSANPAWIRKMDKLVQEFPGVFHVKQQTEISKTYEMPKKYVRIGKPRELSPAQKENVTKSLQEPERKKENLEQVRAIINLQREDDNLCRLYSCPVFYLQKLGEIYGRK